MICMDPGVFNAKEEVTMARSFYEAEQTHYAIDCIARVRVLAIC